MIIQSTTFQNNTSLQGGVFNIESESVVKVYDSLITQNFAVEGGVVKAHNGGYFEFVNTTITRNYALSITIGEILDTASPSVIAGCSIYNNYILTKQQVLSEINSRCVDL